MLEYDELQFKSVMIFSINIAKVFSLPNEVLYSLDTFNIYYEE